MYMIHSSLCVWHWDSLNRSLCELRLVQIAQKQYDLMILEVTWMVSQLCLYLSLFKPRSKSFNPETTKCP